MLNRIKIWRNKNERQNVLISSNCFKSKHEQKLLIKFKEGDKEAFSKVYKRFKKPIFNYVSSKLRDRHMAEEVTQEIFIKSYRFRGSFDPRYKFSTWLWAISKNTLSDWFRKNKQIASHERDALNMFINVDEIPSLSPDPEHLLIECAEQEALFEVMNLLTDLQKKVFFMRLIDHLPYQEIATHLNLSLSSVKCLLHRARNTLIKKLEASQFSEENLQPATRT